MQITEGHNCGWVTFSKQQGHTGEDVANTIRGKGTGWCIAGSEIHIYYTRDKEGEQDF